MQDNEAWQVLILGPQTVRHPGTNTRTSLQEHAGIHFQHGWRVIIRLRIARIDERHVVDVLRNVRKNFLRMSARFTVLSKLER